MIRSHAYTDGRAPRRGCDRCGTLAHGAMSLVNVAYNLSYGWQQPRVTTLEHADAAAAAQPHPVEIGLDGPRSAGAIAELAADPTYPQQFAAAFAARRRSVSRIIIKAIAAFERTLLDGNSAFDAYVFAGQHDALSPGAKRGMTLFFSARIGCSGCHSGFNFSGAWRDRQGATGRASFADDGLGAGSMRVPTLRNIALTAPYMHDGRFATLDAVLDHYQRVGRLPTARMAAGAIRVCKRSP